MKNQCIKQWIDVTPGVKPPRFERCRRITTHPSRRCWQHRRPQDMRADD